MPDAELALLNAYFDMVGKAVKAERGEILKFIGDGVMAVFPVDGRTMADACQGALRAAVQTAGAIERWNAVRSAAGSEAIGYDIALHAGEVMYGNVGASDRLDFTVIGPVVNMVSRLQTLCRDLNETILISSEVARHAPTECRSLGCHPLRGLAAVQEIFAPTDTFRSSATPAK